jgi:hypothetical protein
MRARQDIASIVNAHPPARFSRVEVEPFYHHHLRSQLSQSLQSDHGVHLVFPDDDDDASHEIVLVYEGPAGSSPPYEVPKSRPTAEELQQFQRTLREAEKQILDFINPGQPIVSRAVPVPKKYVLLHPLRFRISPALANKRYPGSMTSCRDSSSESNKN